MGRFATVPYFWISVSCPVRCIFLEGLFFIVFPFSFQALRSASQVLDVSVRTQPRVVCQIPARMVGVLVDDNLIAVPVPAHHDVVIVRGDVPVEIVEPEAFPVSSRHHEYMLRSKAPGEVSVCPRRIDVEMRVVGATIMPDPFVVLGVNVRNFRMTFLVRPNAVLGRRLGLPSCRFRSARSPGSRRGSRAVSRNVSTAKRRGFTAAVLLPTPPLLLRNSSHANQN